MKAKNWIDTTAFTASNACRIWPYHVAANGYGKYKYDGQMQYVHRVVCRLAHGAPKPGQTDAAHSCRNRACANPAHLRWATRRENIADKKKQGTHTRGEAHGPAKLTETQARAILRDTRTQREIAADYGVCRQSVSRIKLGTSWEHLQAA